MNARKNDACRYCGSSELFPFLSLGAQPPSNSFIAPQQLAAERCYPLDVYYCENCCLVQLCDVVPAEIIFDDYFYLSSTSKALRNHYAELTHKATQRFGLKARDVVVDIGCNDGIMLHAYALPGLEKIGVEPSKVADIATQSGLQVYRAFFSPETARVIVAEHGKARLVTATNVYAHVDHIARFTEGITELLAPDGVLIIEAPYLLNTIDDVLFDTIYHEHLCYLSLTPMVPFMARCGLEIFDAERIPVGASGPAIRVYAGLQGRVRVQPNVGRFLAEEERWGIRKKERYTGYAAQVAGIKQKALQLIRDIKAGGHQIGGYGAPAKGNTLLNYFGIGPDLVEYIAETNTLKQGLLTPGSHIPIISEEEFLQRRPDYALLLSWNYLDFFLKNSPYINQGGTFIVPLPQPRIAP